jgi:hypothetical protein
VFDSEGYHLDLLVIHLFYGKKLFEDCNRQKVSVDRCEIIQKAARKIENFKDWLRNAELFIYSTGMAVIAFQVFIKHTSVIARRIL